MDDCTYCEFLEYCKGPHWKKSLGNPCSYVYPDDKQKLEAVDRIMHEHDIRYNTPLF